MLKQSNAFWVVDMPGDQDDHMQIYILNEKNLRQETNRETLGDQVALTCAHAAVRGHACPPGKCAWVAARAAPRAALSACAGRAPPRWSHRWC